MLVLLVLLLEAPVSTYNTLVPNLAILKFLRTLEIVTTYI